MGGGFCMTSGLAFVLGRGDSAGRGSAPASAAADRSDGAGVPRFVAAEFREFLGCGVRVFVLDGLAWSQIADRRQLFPFLGLTWTTSCSRGAQRL